MITTYGWEKNSSLYMEMHNASRNHGEAGKHTHLIKERLRLTVIVAVHPLPRPSVYPCKDLVAEKSSRLARS
jgi:hypothetical protein